MRDILKQLAYKWCEEFGDPIHNANHHSSKEWSRFCGNCSDGLHYAEDVLREVIKRLK